MNPLSYQHDETPTSQSPSSRSQYGNRMALKWWTIFMSILFVTTFFFNFQVETDSLTASIHKRKKHLSGSDLAKHMLTKFLNHEKNPDHDHYFLGKSESKTNDLPVGCQATTIIIRHCEKEDIREHCSALGFQRAEYLASLFGNDEHSRWPAPSYLFALSPGDRNNEKVHNYREVETITPLSKKIGLEIDESYGINQSEKLAERVLEMLDENELCGKVILIAWKHSEISHLCNLLGCSEDNGCPTSWPEYDYDNTVQVIHSYHKQKYPSFVVEEKKNKHRTFGQEPQWWVNGHIQAQNFDPLEFAKHSGGY
jgi:hypothetical protein